MEVCVMHDETYALLAERLAAGRVGIFGRRPCQVCGALDAFLGLFGAIGTHHGDDSLFVARSHGHPGWEFERRLAGASPARCEVCAAEVDAPGVRVDGCFLCAQCAPGWSDSDRLRGLARRRFVEHRYPTLPALQAFAGEVHRMRAGLGAMR
jgi:hypothetical protein